MTTRDTRGRLDSMLAALGGDVIHVPLIEIVDRPEHRRELETALARLHEFDWLLVTSQHGAIRVGEAASSSSVRLGAVGTRTAVVLADRAGRPVDVIPDRQTASDLAIAMPDPGISRSVLIAQADRAGPALAEDLGARGFDVEVVTAYSTALRSPTAAERSAALAADAVVFASGSAVRAWKSVFGSEVPARVVSIGPSTSTVARELGVKITHEAADHDLDGLVRETITALTA